MGDGLEHNCFSPVTDEGLAALLGCKLRPHPDKVAEAAALSSVASPNLKYSLCLPKEILLSELSCSRASLRCRKSLYIIYGVRLPSSSLGIQTYSCNKHHRC